MQLFLYSAKTGKIKRPLWDSKELGGCAGEGLSWPASSSVWWVHACFPYDTLLRRTSLFYISLHMNPGVGDGQGGLACCSLWGRQESYTTERLNWTDMNAILHTDTQSLKEQSTHTTHTVWGNCFILSQAPFQLLLPLTQTHLVQCFTHQWWHTGTLPSFWMDLKIHSLIKNLQKNTIYYNKIVFKFASFYNADLKFKKHSFEGGKKKQ